MKSLFYRLGHIIHPKTSIGIFFMSILLLSCQKEEITPVSKAGIPIPKNLFDCPSDVDGNGVVDVDDFIELVSHFEQSCDDCPSDITGDGIVDVDDFMEFNSTWENPCGLQSIEMRVCPIGAQYRYGRNNYPDAAVDPPIPDGANLALGGVTIKSDLVDGQYHFGSVLNSDSLVIEINGGDGQWVSDGTNSLAGLTIRQVRDDTPVNEYGYWRINGNEDVCTGEIGVDFDYLMQYQGTILQVKYTLYYSDPTYPEVMEGIGYLYGFHENPHDGSCLDPQVFLPFPYDWGGSFVGSMYTVYQ